MVPGGAASGRAVLRRRPYQVRGRAAGPVGHRGRCLQAQELAQRLQSGKYNVAVIDTLHDAELAAVDAFLAQGGGVLACNPGLFRTPKPGRPRANGSAAKGARTRWEMLQDDDKNNVVRDVMNSPLSWSNQVSPPVAKGVPGVLTITSTSTGGLRAAHVVRSLARVAGRGPQRAPRCTKSAKCGTTLTSSHG